MSDERSITDADAEAIATALEAKMVKRFYLDLGKGVWDLAWKAICASAVALAIYGAFLKFKG